MAEADINAYQCQECGHLDEDDEWESMWSDDPTPECAICGGETEWALVTPCPVSDCRSQDHAPGTNVHIVIVV